MKYLILLLTSLATIACQDTSTYDYITNLPSDYDENQPTPLLIFLHGAGERGDDIEKVKVHGPPKLAATGSRDFPAIVISPLCPSGVYWNVNRLESMLAKVKSKYKIDESRIYLTGLSMGGYGTMSWSYAHPEHFAAIMPICGGVLQEERTDAIKNIPIWAFHGAKDSVVPIVQTDAYINALKDAGAQPKYTIYPDVDHDSWTETYDNPEVWDWLFAQKK